MGASYTMFAGGGRAPGLTPSGSSGASLGWYNVKDYGALGDGVTDDRNKLHNLANSIIPANIGATLYFPPGDYNVQSNLTFPANVTVKFARGARIVSVWPENATVTINGGLEAPPAQIVSPGDIGLGTVTLVFGRSSPLTYLIPQWWGAKGDLATDDTAALQAAIVACRGAANDTRRTLLLPAGRYTVAAPLQVGGVSIQGAGTALYGSQLSVKQGFVGSHVLIIDSDVTGATGGQYYEGFHIFGDQSTDVVGGIKLNKLVYYQTFIGIRTGFLRGDGLTLTGIAGNTPTLNTFIGFNVGESHRGHGLTMECGLNNTFIGCVWQDVEKNGINITSSVESVGRTSFVNCWLEATNKVTAGAACYLNNADATELRGLQVATYGTAAVLAHGIQLVNAHRTKLSASDIGAPTHAAGKKLNTAGSRLLVLEQMPSSFSYADGVGLGGVTNGDIALLVDSGLSKVSGPVDASAAGAGQFKFPGVQNPSADVNTLDDYEEGTFIPVFTNLTVVNGTGGATYSGHYTKIGRLVFFRIQIAVTGTCTTESVANSTVADEVPFVPAGAVPLAVVDGNVANLGVGLLSAARRVWTPTWSARNTNIFISSCYEQA